MRAMAAVVSFINSEANGLGNILDFMEFTRDEEVQANCAKVVRICLRDDINYDKVTSLHSDLGNLLLKNTALYLYSDVVLTELLAAVRNFSKSVSKVAFIVKTNTNVLIKLAKLPPSDKI
jgi:pyoverdine/dityrosine biosynthesis protein Dit1